ncbi:MAG: hypothetical protein J07HX64_00921 [halophilic archaeon J07HX64]|jgi:hypothetical protein|nr:MAG: hypothetical protein J07HX64_00921 [halophilic archaeon J07HX64]
MEFDRDLAVQVGITVAVVAVFTLGLVVLSTALGDDVPVEDRQLNGTIDGTYQGEVEDGDVSLVFDGTFNNGVEMRFDGNITGTVDNVTLAEGQFEGDVSGAIDGNATGTVINATLDEEQAQLAGRFNGTATGETADDLTDVGGLGLVGLIAAFLVAMPVFGYLIQRLRSDEA